MDEPLVFKGMVWEHEDVSMQGWLGTLNRVRLFLRLPIIPSHVYRCKMPPVTIGPGETVTFMFPVPLDILDE